MSSIETPKKSLGQHWLNDPASLEAMCLAGQVSSSDTILEIGPGQGTLTQKLVDTAKQVVAVELDPYLAANLSARVRAKNLQVIHADILKFDLGTLPVGYKVIANIPYYLTSNLLRVLSEAKNPPSLIALLVQKEVAERIAARPGTMSLLSVSVQVYYGPTLHEVIPARLFTPPPKVDSQIIRLTRRPRPLIAGQNSQAFFHIVKAGFSNRRKTLLNSLSAGLHISKKETLELLQQADISPRFRPQELSLEQWLTLAKERGV